MAYNAQFTATNQQYNEAATGGVLDVGIFNEATNYAFSQYGPAEGDMFNAFSQSYTQNKEVLADFINNAKPLISLQIVADDLFTDVLDEFFNAGTNPLGGAAQVITNDIARPTAYSNIGDNQYVQRYNDSAAQQFNYAIDLTNYRTIKGTQINMYFNSIATLNAYIKSVAIAVRNGMINAMFQREKMLFSVAMELGLSPYDVGGAVNDLLEVIYVRAGQMQFPNSNFNSQGFTRATKASNIAIVIPVMTSVQVDLQYLVNLFNPELVTNKPFHKIVIDSFPDVWRYSTDHVVTAADVQGGFVDIATQASVQTGNQIGSVLPMGTLATAEAPDAVQTFFGDTLQAWVGDRNAVMFFDDLPFTTLSYPGNLSRDTYMVGQMKRTVAYATGFQTLGIYSVAPTAVSAGQALAANTAINPSEIGVPSQGALPVTYGPNADANLNVRGFIKNPTV